MIMMIQKIYFDHRVSFFDIKQITTNFLCSIAIHHYVHKTYIKEALRRGLNQQKWAKIAGRL